MSSSGEGVGVLKLANFKNQLTVFFKPFCISKCISNREDKSIMYHLQQVSGTACNTKLSALSNRKVSQVNLFGPTREIAALIITMRVRCHAHSVLVCRLL